MTDHNTHEDNTMSATGGNQQSDNGFSSELNNWMTRHYDMPTNTVITNEMPPGMEHLAYFVGIVGVRTPIGVAQAQIIAGELPSRRDLRCGIGGVQHTVEHMGQVMGSW